MLARIVNRAASRRLTLRDLAWGGVALILGAGIAVPRDSARARTRKRRHRKSHRTSHHQGHGKQGDQAPAGGKAVAGDVALVEVGDIAACDRQGDSETAQIAANHAGAVLMLGDGTQKNGTTREWEVCYDQTWGPFKASTHPAIGNHEYNSPGGTPYWDYWGRAAGERGKGWYSFDHAGWHIIALNSNCRGGLVDERVKLGAEGAGNIDCTADSEQMQWLRDDLAATQATCILAFWHHPIWHSKTEQTPFEYDGRMLEAWRALSEAGATLVLNGHIHIYERFPAHDAEGHPDPNGITSITVGTGGFSHHPIVKDHPDSVIRNDDTFGVLALTLGDGEYAWEFLPVAGMTFRDSGRGTCARRSRK
jgi:alkaline phosphatase